MEEDAIEAGAEDYQIIDPQEKVFRDISAKSRGTWEGAREDGCRGKQTKINVLWNKMKSKKRVKCIFL